MIPDHAQKTEIRETQCGTVEQTEDSAVPLLHQDVRTAVTDNWSNVETGSRSDNAVEARKYTIGSAETGATHKKTSKYGHRPRKIFVELDILSGLGEDREWKETSRWIKYEEDVEEGADRWGKPHVASLSFHSILGLRQLMETGCILMDLEECDLTGVAYRVVDQMVNCGKLDSDYRGYVMRSLLLKHRHVIEGDRNWFNLKRYGGSTVSLQLQNPLEEKSKAKQTPLNLNVGSTAPYRRNSEALDIPKMPSEVHANGRRKTSFCGSLLVPENQLQQLQHSTVDVSKVSLAHLSEEDLRWMTNKEGILRRIPAGAEASLVMVGYEEHLSEPFSAFVRLAESVYMPNVTEVPLPVRFIFILLSPSSYDLDAKEIGRSIATLMSNEDFHDIAYRADDRKDLLKGIHAYLDGSIVLPPGDYEEELFPFDDLREKNESFRLRKQRLSIAQGVPNSSVVADSHEIIQLLQAGKPSEEGSLQRTKRCFGGLLRDIHRRFPLYLSDMRDGVNMQCLAAIIFMAFAQISGSIAFGGLVSQKTHGYMGITETLCTSAFGGLLFALFSAQPLLILGTTGPLVLFDESLFSFCESNNMDFLATRTWIGFWLFVIGTVFVAFEGSILVRYCSKFTIEIFASLVSLLFIADSLQNLFQVYVDHPLVSVYGTCMNSSEDGVPMVDPGEPHKNQPNTALLSTILMLCTFCIAWFLRAFRNGDFLTKLVRNTVGNFAVPVSIAAMVAADFLIKETVTQKLKTPDGFRPTMDRSWLVDPSAVGLWIPVLALLPALLLFILVFMETSISELFVSKSENKLKRGSGFHLDVLIICGVNTVLSIFGLPWVNVALVRAVSHVSALTIWSTNNAPGEKPVIIGIHEQRLTALIISILCGVSVAAASALKVIPMAVLFGVFFFMGISSMSGIDLFERFSLFFKQVENHPNKPFVRKVRTRKMHLFTSIQIFWLAVLWGVKYTSAALSFPFILLILVPFRFFVLQWFFTSEELSALDPTDDGRKEPKQIHGLQSSNEKPMNASVPKQLNDWMNEMAINSKCPVKVKVIAP